MPKRSWRKTKRLFRQLLSASPSADLVPSRKRREPIKQVFKHELNGIERLEEKIRRTTDPKMLKRLKEAKTRLSESMNRLNFLVRLRQNNETPITILRKFNGMGEQARIYILTAIKSIGSYVPHDEKFRVDFSNTRTKKAFEAAVEELFGEIDQFYIERKKG